MGSCQYIIGGMFDRSCIHSPDYCIQKNFDWNRIILKYLDVHHSEIGLFINFGTIFFSGNRFIILNSIRKSENRLRTKVLHILLTTITNGKNFAEKNQIRSDRLWYLHYLDFSHLASHCPSCWT